MKHAAHDGQGFWRGHPQPIDGVLFDAGRRQLHIQLRASTVNDDRGQAHVLQKGQRGHQCIQIITQHRATHFDHRKTRGVELREALEVLLDFRGAAHAGQQSDDGGAQIGHGEQGKIRMLPEESPDRHAGRSKAG